MDAQVGLAAAFVAGILSFFSPCVVPMVPIYLGYMTGTAAGQGAGRLRSLAHALAFVVGFAAVFALLGAAAGLVGGVIYGALPWIIRLGGVLLLVMGWHLMGWVTLPFLNMDKRLEVGGGGKGLGPRRWWGWCSPRWTPCIGPVLTAILLLAADSQTAGPARGCWPSIPWPGVPFLVVAGLIDVIGLGCGVPAAPPHRAGDRRGAAGPHGAGAADRLLAAPVVRHGALGG